MEPYRLKHWNAPTYSSELDFYTCARPGRSGGPKGQVSDELVRRWVSNLPGNGPIVLFSLLGRKQGAKGQSEFHSFYSFYGPWDSDRERAGRPSFENWLSLNFSGRVCLMERPTYDNQNVPPQTMKLIESDIRSLPAGSWTVVIMDSGGCNRVKPVCDYLGLVEDTACS